MRSTTPAVIVLPDAYARSERRFPVVYVLHGWSGNQEDWVAKTDIEALADAHGIILVMPDGGYNKWYVDSVVDPDVKYQTYVGQEVVGFVDDTYRTCKERYGRAITGLSMGGFGALNVAVKNQATFGMAGSISGGVDPRDFAKNWGLEAVFGDKDEHGEFWDEKASSTTPTGSSSARQTS
jgi:putative tributyrin esterase